jgi:hypothetical protein
MYLRRLMLWACAFLNARLRASSFSRNSSDCILYHNCTDPHTQRKLTARRSFEQ